MQFFCIRNEAIRQTHSALQTLSGARQGSLRPGRVLRVAQLYGYLQWRSRGSRDVRITLRDLAAAWFVQPRLLKADLDDLQSLGWLRFSSDANGTTVRLERSGCPEVSLERPAPEPAAQREPQPAHNQLMAQFVATYNQHKPQSWPAYKPTGKALLGRLQRAIRHAGGPEAFWAALIRALRSMPEFWRSTYPQGRSGVECATALFSADRKAAGLGVELWHVFLWGAMAQGVSHGSAAEPQESELEKANRLLFWSCDHWRGRGIEAAKLDRREKQRLAELLEAQGEGRPGSAAEQFSRPPRAHG